MAELHSASDDEIINLILQHEGGVFTNDPADRGGPTKWGITLEVLSWYLGRPATIDEIRALPLGVAREIYRRRNLRPFDGIPDPLRVNAIDMGVNAGIGRSIRLLQQTIGATVDGAIGPKTRLLAQSRDWNTLYTGVRLAFYEDLIIAVPSDLKWRPGWRARALSLERDRSAEDMRRRGSFSLDNLYPLFGFTGKAYAA